MQASKIISPKQQIFFAKTDSKKCAYSDVTASRFELKITNCLILYLDILLNLN